MSIMSRQAHFEIPPAEVATAMPPSQPISMWSCLLYLICLGASFLQADETSEKDWPVSRGNPESTAVANTRLPQKLNLLWEYKSESDKAGFEGSPIIYDGKVIVGDVEGTVHAIDLKKGTSEWKFKSEGGFLTAAAAHEGRIVIGDFNAMIYCLDAKDGSSVWTREIEQPIASGANFYKNQTLVACESGSMQALDLKTGEPQWNYTTGDQLRSSPTIWKSFSMLGGCDGRLHKIDLNTAEATGEGMPLQAPTLSTPAVVGRVAIVPTQPGVILAVDLEKNQTVWTFSNTDVASDVRSSPAVLGALEQEKLQGVAVVASRNRRVFALNLADGSLRWEVPLKKRSDSSPVICDGRAWIGGADGMVYGLDLETGKETWTYQLLGQILASPAIAHGRLIVATEKGSVYCFGE